MKSLPLLYPIYVRKDAGSAYSAAFPDFPGCFAAADEAQDLPRAAQEAVEAHYGADDEAVPEPSAPDAHAHSKEYRGGFWKLVDIDLSRVRQPCGAAEHQPARESGRPDRRRSQATAADALSLSGRGRDTRNGGCRAARRHCQSCRQVQSPEYGARVTREGCAAFQGDRHAVHELCRNTLFREIGKSDGESLGLSTGNDALKGAQHRRARLWLGSH